MRATFLKTFFLFLPAIVLAGEGPYGPTCEYLRDPLGVVKPRFFWKYKGERPDEWRLTVASDPSRLAEGDVYAGAAKDHLYVEPSLALQPFTRYWWRIEGGGGAADGSFVSGIARWRMPFFARAWEHDPNEYWRARKTVRLERPTRAVIAVTSRGIHRLYVNGRPASEGLAPNRSHIEGGILLAETYDVTGLVRDGENEFELLIYDGWARFKTCARESCVSVDGRVETSRGAVSVDSREPWLVSHTGEGAYFDSGTYGFGNFGGERLRDVREVSGECPGRPVDGSAFSVSCDVSERDSVLAEFHPVSVEPREGAWRIDMGREFTGFVRMKLKGEPGSAATLTVSDNLTEKCSYHQAQRYEFRDGDGVFVNRLNWIAGRYLWLTGCERPSVGDVTGYSIGCVGRRTGAFTGDGDLEMVLALDADTYVATTASGVTMDCPHRERLGYGEASLSSMWGVGVPYFDSAAFYYAYLLKWASSQEPDGHIPHVSPDFEGGGGTFWSNFPIYAFADFWRLYPDVRLRNVIRPVAEKWLDYLHAHTQSGILQKYEKGKWGFLGDWAMPDGTLQDWGDSREAAFFNTCSYAWAIRRVLETEGLVPDAARRVELQRRLDVLQRAVDREFYKNGLYLDAHARYQAMGLVSGAAERGGHADATERAMIEITEKKGYVDGGSPSFTVLLRELCRTARGREAVLKALRRHERPGYLFFADEGYNTLPEFWSADRNATGSMIHTCYTGAAGALMYGFAGFDVNGSEIAVRPLLSDSLPNFAAKLETLYGTLALRVETRGNDRTITVTVPSGCRAQLLTDGASRLHPGVNRVVLSK